MSANCDGVAVGQLQRGRQVVVSELLLIDQQLADPHALGLVRSRDGLRALANGRRRSSTLRRRCRVFALEECHVPVSRRMGRCPRLDTLSASSTWTPSHVIRRCAVWCRVS